MTLGLLVVAAGAGIWLLLPPLVGTLAQGALVAAGFQADTTTVEVTADPPPNLLTLHADAIHIRATNARYRGLGAVDVDLTLRDVRLLDRTFGRVDGTLHFVTVPATADRPALTIPEATLSGSADEVQVTLTFAGTTAQELAAAALERAIGITPSRVVLIAPDRARIEVGGRAVDARLALREDGALVLDPPAGVGSGPIPLVQPGPDVPFRIASFRIVDGGLVVVATFDPQLGRP